MQRTPWIRILAVLAAILLAISSCGKQTSNVGQTGNAQASGSQSGQATGEAQGGQSQDASQTAPRQDSESSQTKEEAQAGENDEQPQQPSGAQGGFGPAADAAQNAQSGGKDEQPQSGSQAGQSQSSEDAQTGGKDEQPQQSGEGEEDEQPEQVGGDEQPQDPKEDAAMAFVTGKQAQGSSTYVYSGQSVERVYEYYIPSSFQQGQPMALMLTLHGSGSTGAEQMADGDFVRLAEREGFVAVAPNAVGISIDNKLCGDGRGMKALGQSNAANLRWHAASSDPIHDFKVDDTAYLCDLIDTFVNAGIVDPHRVYVSGLSHGAFMSIRMALEAPEKIAGIAPVAGELCSEYEDLTPRSAVKMVFIQGNKDWVVPIDGMIYGSYVWAYSTDDTIAWFLEKYGYPVQITDTQALPDTNAADGCSITRYSYTDADGVERVVKYVVSNGGHNWPGGKLNLGMEPYCKDVLATELIWNDLKDIRK